MANIFITMASTLYSVTLCCIFERPHFVTKANKTNLLFLDNFPPSIYAPGSLMVNFNEEFTYVAHVNDSNGDDITVTTNIPSTVVILNGEASITATVRNKTTGFTVIAKVITPQQTSKK